MASLRDWILYAGEAGLLGQQDDEEKHLTHGPDVLRFSDIVVCFASNERSGIPDFILSSVNGATTTFRCADSIAPLKKGAGSIFLVSTDRFILGSVEKIGAEENGDKTKYALS